MMLPFAIPMLRCRARGTAFGFASRPFSWRWLRKENSRGDLMSIGFRLVHARPSRTRAIVLSWLLFALGAGLYLRAAQKRHLENVDDRVMPTIAQMMRGLSDAALKPSEDDQALAENASL